MGFRDWAVIFLLAYILTNLVLPSFASFVFRFFLSAETVLALFSFLLFLNLRFLWPSNSDGLATTTVLSSAVLPPALDEPRAMQALLRSLLLLYAPRIDMGMTFYANEVLRVANPLPFLKEPTVVMTIGAHTAPTLMHLREEPSGESLERNFSADFVLDSSDIEVKASWLNDTVLLTCSNIRAAGRLMLHISEMNEISFSVDLPMWSVDVNVSGSSAGFAPEKLRLAFLSLLESQLRNWNLQKINLGVVNFQEYLRSLSVLAPYSTAANLAMEAGLQRMRNREVKPSSQPVFPADESVPTVVVSSTQPLVKKTAKAQGRPLVLGDLVLGIDQDGELKCFSGSGFSGIAGLVLDNRRDLVGAEDKEGVVIAGVSRESKKVVICWKRAGSSSWAWRELQQSLAEGSCIIGLVCTQLWHVIVQEEFVVVCVSVERWNSNAVSKSKPLGPGLGACVASSKSAKMEIAIVSRGELCILSAKPEDADLLFEQRTQLKLAHSVPPLFVCARVKKNLIVAWIGGGHVFVNREDVTEQLRQDKVAVSDAIGQLAVAVRGGELVFAFRDILGVVNVLIDKKLTHVPNSDAVGDIVLRATSFSVETRWIGSDGNYHKQSV